MATFLPELLLAEQIEYELRVRGSSVDGHILVLCKRLRDLLDKGVPLNREILHNMDAEEEKARIGEGITKVKQQFEDFQNDPLHGREKQLIARLEHLKRRVDNLKIVVEDPEESVVLGCFEDTILQLLQEVKEFTSENLDTILDLSKLVFSRPPVSTPANNSTRVSFSIPQPSPSSNQLIVSTAHSSMPPQSSVTSTASVSTPYRPLMSSYMPEHTFRNSLDNTFSHNMSALPLASSTYLPPFFNQAMPQIPYQPFQPPMPVIPFPGHHPLPSFMAPPTILPNTNPFFTPNQNQRVLPTNISSFAHPVSNSANFPSFPSVPSVHTLRNEDSRNTEPGFSTFNSTRASQRVCKSFSKLKNPLEKMVRDLPHIDGLDRELLLKFIGRILRMKEQPHLQDEELYDCIFPFTSPPLSELIRDAMDRALCFEEFHSEILRQFFPRASFAYSRVDRRQGETESLSSYVQDIIFSARVLKVRMTETELVDTVLANLNSVSRNHCAFQQRPTTLAELNRLCVVSQDYALADQHRPRDAGKNSLRQIFAPNSNGKVSTHQVDTNFSQNQNNSGFNSSAKKNHDVNGNNSNYNSSNTKQSGETEQPKDDNANPQRKLFKCYSCGKDGHTSRFCRQKPEAKN